MFDREAAIRLAAGLKLEDNSRQLVEHWLSLWPGNALPPRSAFHPAQLKHFLPSLILFNVVPDVSVRVRLAGTRYNHILGTELTNRDWIAAAPEAHRPVRLGVFSAVAGGAILLDHRLVAMAVGDDAVVEEVLLPFAPDQNGASTVLAHVNLRADQYLRAASAKQVMADPIDFQIVPLPKAAPLAA